MEERENCERKKANLSTIYARFPVHAPVGVQKSCQREIGKGPFLRLGKLRVLKQGKKKGLKGLMGTPSR